MTSRERVLAGHFTLVRTGSPIEKLAFEDARLRADVRKRQHVWADEERFSEIVREAADAGVIRVHWPASLAGAVDLHGNEDVPPWLWQDGRVSHAGREFSYLHFMHWKHLPDFRCSLQPGVRHARFTISPSGSMRAARAAANTIVRKSPECRSGASTSSLALARTEAQLPARRESRATAQVYGRRR